MNTFLSNAVTERVLAALQGLAADPTKIGLEHIPNALTFVGPNPNLPSALVIEGIGDDLGLPEPNPTVGYVGTFNGKPYWQNNLAGALLSLNYSGSAWLITLDGVTLAAITSVSDFPIGLMGWTLTAPLANDPIITGSILAATYLGQLCRVTGTTPDSWWLWNGTAWEEDAAEALTEAAIVAALGAGSLPVAKVGGLALTATSTDAANLTGTLAPARIADGALTIAKTSGLQAALAPIPPRRTKYTGGMFSALRLALDANRSAQIAVVGDSLGNAPEEYAESFAEYLHTLYPSHRLVRRLIVENASAGIRNWAETVLHAGLGERHWYFPASNTGVQGVTLFPSDCPVPTGDFDLEIKLRVGNWENNHGLNIVEWWGSGSPRLTRVLAVRMLNSRRLQLQWYNDAGVLKSPVTGNLGTVAGAVTATATADGSDWTLRVRFDADNGAGASVITYAKSTDDGATWTDMTSITEAATTGLWQVPPPDEIQATIGGPPTLAIKDTRIYDLKVRHGHGTKIVNRRAIDYASMGSVSNLVTLAGSPTIYLDNFSYPGRTTRDLRTDLLGLQQVATATATGTVSGAGDATVTVTAAGLTGSPLAINFAVANSDTPALWGPKCRTALAANGAIAAMFNVTGFGSSVQLERKFAAANDATLSIALATGTATGITSTSSTITTVGNAAHVERLFDDYGVGVLFFHGGINDQWAGDFTGGSRRWVQGVDDIVDAVRARNDDLTPILIATNPKSFTLVGNLAITNDHQTLRHALMANHARRNQWGFVDVWTAFYDDGRALTTLITDGTHPSTTAYAEIWNPLINDAFDTEAR